MCHVGGSGGMLPQKILQFYIHPESALGALSDL